MTPFFRFWILSWASIIFLLIFAGTPGQFQVYDGSIKVGSVCGHKSCDKEKLNALNIHIIAFSPIMWLNTNQLIKSEEQPTAMNHVTLLDGVLEALSVSRRRRFTQTEVGSFHYWWSQLNKTSQASVHSLVESGQLHFTAGSWFNTDQSSIPYNDLLDQWTDSFRKLHKLFSHCGLLKTAWDIDSHGYSRDHIDLWYQLGIRSAFVRRNAMVTGTPTSYKPTWPTEFLWKPTKWEKSRRLLTIALPGLSSKGQSDERFSDVCFKLPKFHLPTTDGFNHTEANDKLLKQFVEQVQKYANLFDTNHVPLLVGCELTHDNVLRLYNSVDDLIGRLKRFRFSAMKPMHPMYSTPTCYVKASKKARQLSTTALLRTSGDLLSIVDNKLSTWPAYFTSSTELGSLVRYASVVLHSCESFRLFGDISTGRIESSGTSSILHLRRSISATFHKDIVNGKPEILTQQEALLIEAIMPCLQLISRNMLRLNPGLAVLTGGSLPLICRIDRELSPMESRLCTTIAGQHLTWNTALISAHVSGVHIMLYNPTGWRIKNAWYRLPIFLPALNSHLTFDRLNHESMKWEPVFYEVHWIRKAESSESNAELLLSAANEQQPIPPLGMALFKLALNPKPTVDELNVNQLSESKFVSQCPPSGEVVRRRTSLKWQQHLEGEMYLKADYENGSLVLNLSVTMMFYADKTAAFGDGNHNSVFDSLHGEAKTFDEKQIKFQKNRYTNTLNVHYGDWSSIDVRLYCNQDLEVHWSVGPRSSYDETTGGNRAIIIRYNVTGEAIRPGKHGDFYTDSSGQNLIHRQQPYDSIEQSHTVNESDNVFYPVLNRIMLKGEPNWDHEGQPHVPMGLVVYTDRAHGGTSPAQGCIDLVLHRGSRREMKTIHGVHRIRLDELSVLMKADFQMSRLNDRPLVAMVSHAGSEVHSSQPISWQGLTKGLPKYVHLLSLTSWPISDSKFAEHIEDNDEEPEQLLLRLENRPYRKVDLNTSTTRTIDVTNLFSGIRIVRAKPVTLTGTEEIHLTKKSGLPRWPEHSDKQTQSSRYPSSEKSESPRKVELILGHAAIETFILDYERLSGHV